MDIEVIKSVILKELKVFEESFKNTILDLKKDSSDIKTALLGDNEFGTVGFKQRIEAIEREVVKMNNTTTSEIAVLKVAIADLSIKKDIKILIAVATSVLVTSCIAWLLTHLLK